MTDKDSEIERLRAALESTRHKTSTPYNYWLDSVLGKRTPEETATEPPAGSSCIHCGEDHG